MDFIEKLEKKHRYLIQSFIIGIYLYLASFPFFNSSFYIRVGVGFLLIWAGVLFTQYPNIKIRNIFMSTLVPTHLLLGALLTLKYYPNLSMLFRLVIILGFSGMYYVGCKNIKKLHQKAKFIKITQASLQESHPHDVLITNGGENYK